MILYSFCQTLKLFKRITNIVSILKIFNFMNLDILPIHISTQQMCMLVAHRGQGRSQIPCYWSYRQLSVYTYAVNMGREILSVTMTENQTWVLWKSSYTFNLWAITSTPKIIFLMITKVWVYKTKVQQWNKMAAE